MNPMRKPRPEAVLKNLPDAVQRALGEYLGDKTLGEAVDWLKTEHGVATSDSALSRWWAWRQARFKVEAVEAAAEAAAEQLGAKQHWTNEQIRNAGQRLFSLMSIGMGNGQLFIGLQHAAADVARAELAQREFAHAREKWELDVTSTVRGALQELLAVEDDTTLADADKTAAVRRRLFGKSAEATEPNFGGARETTPEGQEHRGEGEGAVEPETAREPATGAPDNGSAGTQDFSGACVCSPETGGGAG
jgi:hypothetical protein